jgi:hypothetical protein
VNGRCFNGALPIRRQDCGVLVFDPQVGAVIIARVDKIAHRGFLFEDRVERKALMAFALVCGAGRGQPHPDIVDGGSDQLTWCAVRIDRELRTDDLYQVGASPHPTAPLAGRRRWRTQGRARSGANNNPAEALAALRRLGAPPAAHRG